MLKKVNEGRVESDDGWLIHIARLECLRYEEADYLVDLEWNYDPIIKKTYIYVSNLKEVDENKKLRIITNINEAMKLLSGNFELV